MEASLDVLRELGAQVVDVKLPSIDDYQACYRAIVMSEAFAIHAHDLRKHPEKFSAVTRFRILPGALPERGGLCRGAAFSERIGGANPGSPA